MGHESTKKRPAADGRKNSTDPSSFRPCRGLSGPGVNLIPTAYALGLTSIGPPSLGLTQCALSFDSRAPCLHQTSDQLSPRGGTKAQRCAAVLYRGAHRGITLKEAGRQHFGQFLLHVPKSFERPAGHAAFAAVGQQFMLGENYVSGLHRKTV